jgi:hypothetical protein
MQVDMGALYERHAVEALRVRIRWQWILGWRLGMRRQPGEAGSNWTSKSI